MKGFRGVFTGWQNSHCLTNRISVLWTSLHSHWYYITTFSRTLHTSPTVAVEHEQLENVYSLSNTFHLNADYYFKYVNTDCYYFAQLSFEGGKKIVFLKLFLKLTEFEFKGSRQHYSLSNPAGEVGQKQTFTSHFSSVFTVNYTSKPQPLSFPS